MVVLAAATLAQTKPDDVKIIPPTVDKTSGRVTLPAAFWNEQMTDWVETAVCGRPSDFLHETILAVTTTRHLLEQSLRDIGCHDADAWVSSVRDFPRVRGDRLLILVEVTRDGKKETYALDEMLAFQDWNVSVGPYGWMFKGEPGAATEPAPATRAGDSDATRILHDDPQVAIVFKGIQSASQSFIDHPIPYADQEWVYRMPRFHRNAKLLPRQVYDSNGAVPVTLTFQKVTEEQFLTEAARVWHDAAFRKYMLDQLPVAREIDRDKAALWSLRSDLGKLLAAPPEQRDVAAANQAAGRVSLMSAALAAGYALLDAAWANWAADHATFDNVDPAALPALKRETQLWRQRAALEQTRTAQLARAQGAAYEQQQLERQPQTDANKARLQLLRGQEMEARSAALRAGNTQPLEYWKQTLAGLDPKTDPRSDWIKQVHAEVELCTARAAAAEAGIAYGRALQATPSPADLPRLQADYARATLRITLADARLQLIDIDFEISKREGFDDPQLPALRQKKAQLEAQLKDVQSATQPK